ncbi:hypothetical protein CUMW_043460 [Citrus unshiu]|nr:hypothetical protein CUMW_043460 [Citrus unshiu]
MDQAVLITDTTPLLIPSRQNHLTASPAIKTRHKPRTPTTFTRLPPYPHLHACRPQHPPEFTRLVQLCQLINSTHIPTLDKNPRHSHSLTAQQILQLVQELPMQRHVTLVSHHAVHFECAPHTVAVLVRAPHSPQRRRVNHDPIRTTRRTLFGKITQRVSYELLVFRLLAFFFPLHSVPHNEYILLHRLKPFSFCMMISSGPGLVVRLQLCPHGLSFSQFF